MRAVTKVTEIADRLLTAIAVGEYLPGSKFPNERQLAENLGVSRVTVREAMARLRRDGVVEVRRGRGGGSFVSGADGETVREAAARSLGARWDQLVSTIEAISRLQETIVRAAAERRTGADVVALEARLEAFRAAESGRPKQAADGALHLAVCEAAHVPALTEMLLLLEKRISIAAPAHLWGAHEDQVPMEARALADHVEAVRLIREGEVEAGGTLARRHARIDLALLEDVRHRTGPQPAAGAAQTSATP